MRNFIRCDQSLKQTDRVVGAVRKQTAQGRLGEIRISFGSCLLFASAIAAVMGDGRTTLAASLESAGSTAPGAVPTAISCQDQFLLDRRDNPEKALKNLHQCTAVRNVAINMEYFTFWYVTLPPGSPSKQDWRFEKTWKSNIGILTSRVVNLEKDQAVSVLDESIARGLKRGRRGDLVEKWLANHNAEILIEAQPVAAQGQTTPVAPVVAAASTPASSPPAAAAAGKPAVVQEPARSEKASPPPPAQRTASAAAASAGVPPPPAPAEKPAAAEQARPEKASTLPAAHNTASAAATPVTTPGSTAPPADKPAAAPELASPEKTTAARPAQRPEQARRTQRQYAPARQGDGYRRASAAAGPYPAPPPGAWYGPGPMPYYGPQHYYPAPAGPYGAPPYYPPPPVAQAPPPAPVAPPLASPAPQPTRPQPAPVVQDTRPAPPPAAPAARPPAQPVVAEQSRAPAPAAPDMAQRTLLEQEIDRNVRSMSQMIENNVRTIEQTFIKPTFFNK